MSHLGLVEGNKLMEITKHGYSPLTNWEDPPSMLEKVGPHNQTWNLKLDTLKRRFLFYVKFPGSK